MVCTGAFFVIHCKSCHTLDSFLWFTHMQELIRSLASQGGGHVMLFPHSPPPTQNCMARLVRGRYRC